MSIDRLNTLAVTGSITSPPNDNASVPALDFDGNGSITALDAYLYVGNLLAQ